MTKETVSLARLTALEVLEKVWEQGAYANLALQQALDSHLTPADRALATEIVYGTLRQRLLLDWHLQSFLSKPLSTLPETVQHVLRIGAYQILFLDRVPARAAINEAVNQVKARGIAGLSGLVNAVLRNLERNQENLALPDPQKEPDRYISVTYSHPLWMVRRWLKRWGFEATVELCQYNNTPAPTTLRTNTLRIGRDALLAELAAQGVEAEPGDLAPESIHLRKFSSVEELEPFQRGLCTVQDESSMLVAHVLDVQPGEYVIDVCAAPGGKTTHIAQRMENKGVIKAFELHPHKLPLISGTCRRLGIDCVEVKQGDAARLSELVTEQADRVLVDAPCSGLGVLRRKPDARWKKEESVIKQLQELQLQILLEAAKLVKPGGTLVYSTCTIEPEENFEVVKAFRKEHSDFAPVDLNPLLPFVLEREGDKHMAAKGYLQLLPSIDNVDGFFIACLTRIV